MRTNLMTTSRMAAAALAACLPGLAAAQSLQELYEAARMYDAAYMAARANLQAAEFRAAQSEALLKPSATATASATHGQLDLPRVGSGSNTTLLGSLQGRYPLLNRANAVTVEQARKSLDATRAELDTVEQDLVVRVAQAYFDVLASQDGLGTAQTAKKAIAEQLASAKRNFEVGTATITDTREAQARFDLATATEIAAENDLRTKRIALDQLVGRFNVQPRPLSLPATLPATQPADVVDWVRDAETRHPTVLRASVAVETATLEVSKARAAERPTVDAVGTVSAQNANGGAVSLAGRTLSASAGVQMTWPLYTGGATHNRIRETLSLLDKSRNDLEAARRGVAQVTRQAFFSVQSGLAQVKALEAAESSSKLALEATQTGYRVGVRVNLDVLNAQTQLFQTQRDLAKARYDVIVGGLKLRQAAGVLTAGDIEAVNRLLAK